MDRNINVWLPLKLPRPGTWPATQACVLTRNRTSNLWVHRLVLNPLSHASRGSISHTHAITLQAELLGHMATRTVFGVTKSSGEEGPFVAKANTCLYSGCFFSS